MWGPGVIVLEGWWGWGGAAPKKDLKPLVLKVFQYASHYLGRVLAGCSALPGGVVGKEGFSARLRRPRGVIHLPGTAHYPFLVLLMTW